MMSETGKEMEKKWQDYWEKEGIYGFDWKSKSPSYVIDTPPPTVSGKMHLGHAFSYTQQDFVARYKRMKGFNVFNPFGYDDNGLATDRFVEKKRGIRAKNFSRKEYINICLKETKIAEEKLKDDFSSLGLSVDWGECYRTIDSLARKLSQKSFIEIYGMKRAYRKEAPTMWCPTCSTAIAQAELEDKKQKSTLVYLKFRTTDGKKIVIATTRPELMPACVAIHVNPKDKRHKGLIGKEAEIPFYKRKVKIYANPDVNMEFGTGAVYHCTWGDLEDVKWVMEYGIPVMEVMGKDGKFNEKAGKYAGMKTAEARKAVVEDLRKAGLVEKEEPVEHVVNCHERCKTPVEIITAKQWFIKYMDLRKKFLELGKKIKWHPRHMRVRYDNWIKGLKWDWNISRQRHYGVPFPVWYCKKCGKEKLAELRDLPVDPLADKPKGKCVKCGEKKFEPEKDVMDTWATSSLTPQINAHWGEDRKRFNRLFPMHLRPQAHDIITLWAFNTVVKAYLHHKMLPWKEIIISGHALDPKGRKMSKSLGNAVEPKEVIEKYSADILRYWSGSASLGEDLPFQEQDLVAGKKFVTKLLNASRFAVKACEGFEGKEKKLKFRATDKWILSRLASLIESGSKAMEEFEYSKCLNPVRDFFWLEFADYYLEEIKWRIYAGEKEDKRAAQFTLNYVLNAVLRMLAPFLPHITEEVYQNVLKEKGKKSIHREEWPKPEKKFLDKESEALGKKLNEMVSALRKFKNQNGMPLNAELGKVEVQSAEKGFAKSFMPIEEDLRKTMNIRELRLMKEAGKGKKVEAGENIALFVDS